MNPGHLTARQGRLTGHATSPTDPSPRVTTFTYTPDGQTHTEVKPNNNTSNAETLMSADNSTHDLTHTLTNTYDPLDRLTTVPTDGTLTESYQHDPNNNIMETINGIQTTYTYDLNRLMQATTAGTTQDYNYDPLGRLDTVTFHGSGAHCLFDDDCDPNSDPTSPDAQWFLATKICERPTPIGAPRRKGHSCSRRWACSE